MTDAIAGGQPVDEPQKPSTRDKLKAARLPERTVDICLRGDLQAEWEDLHRQLAEAEAKAGADNRLNSASKRDVKAVAARIEAVEEEMRAETLVFRLRALSKRAWGDLLKKHPPRRNNDEDAVLGYNPDEFFPAAIRACTYSPDDLDDETWRELLDDRLTEYQFGALQNAVMALNVRKVDVPNSRAASRILRTSESE
ncbi:MAG TPA: hypothetical protein VGD43_24385 [Micromonospora sp.]